ncbi:sigma-54 dependent transcriptional regulator [Devosia rhodophyticola]|uniref:Sigma-54 dependent transcriptional regulator n=1 Tax=Devosia rhodophyticola TaxID=3026423 RepID=A0ABY7YUV9_9HYPH|nr:sigma-54 dependent transcriptional regulator [Devosia rhodophyticola]WDR04962.1 sigma-54 dependent transcriptional regulator [Devosia rhodophyticola]
MRLLIVGALEGQLSEATKLAMQGGAKVAHAPSIEIALATLRAGRGADLLLVDVMMDIAALIAGLAAERIAIPLVACGVETNAAAAVNAIRAGAKEYIPLPPDADLIAAVIAAVARDASEFLFRDPAMERVVKMADQIAGSDASVLITGESGTGKEVVAKYLHAHSKRASKPFISINCAAIPEALLESELFGHEKGAFTGAIGRRIGKFEEANAGTLLLDEISEMDFRLQSKLLRAIQERLIDRVGGSKPVPVDIRILATSNRNLNEAVREGSFREDLLFRLNVVNLKLPALRDRPGDIAALSDHFVAKYAKANGLTHRTLSPEAQVALLGAPWPGNVRELENTLHRAVLLSQTDIIGPDAISLPDGTGLSEAAEAHSLSAQLAQTAETMSRAMVGRTVADVERDLILDTLDHTLGNRTHAANILGISIRTLRNKLNQYADEGTFVPGPGEQRSVA